MSTTYVSIRASHLCRRSFLVPISPVKVPSFLLSGVINNNSQYLHAQQASRSQSTKYHMATFRTPNMSAVPNDKASAAEVNDPVKNKWERFDARYATEVLFKECARQADYIVPQAFERSGATPKNHRGEDVGEGSGYWYEDIGMIPTFANWAQITMLYMYLFTVRMRCLPPEHAEKWLQLLHDHFFYEAEHRMNLFHGITSRMVRNRHLKDLYNQWRGVLGAYDEGLIKGDAVLGTAIWRNIFQGDQDTSWELVALIVSFMRRSLRGLDLVQDETVMTASLQFGNLLQELQVVKSPSEGINEKF